MILLKIVENSDFSKKQAQSLKKDWIIYSILNIIINSVCFFDLLFLSFEFHIIGLLWSEADIKEYKKNGYCWHAKYLSDDDKTKLAKGNMIHITWREIIYIILENILCGIQICFFAPGSHRIKKRSN